MVTYEQSQQSQLLQYTPNFLKELCEDYFFDIGIIYNSNRHDELEVTAYKNMLLRLLPNLKIKLYPIHCDPLQDDISTFCYRCTSVFVYVTESLVKDTRCRKTTVSS